MDYYINFDYEYPLYCKILSLKKLLFGFRYRRFKLIIDNRLKRSEIDDIIMITKYIPVIVHCSML